MMDYYQELGLNRSASTAEIRQAYRRLARLLHPDVCSDAPLRQLAELQMKRLNEVLSVLTDSAARREYDLRLASRLVPSQFPRLPARNPPKWSYIAAGAVTLVTLASLLVRGSHSPPVEGRPEPMMVATTDQKQPVNGKSPRRIHMDPPRHPVPRIVSRLDTGPSPELPPDAPLYREAVPIRTEEGSVHRSERSAVSLQLLEIPHEADRRTLAGEWLFAPSLHAQGAGLYPPEYIELRLTEESGILRGRYRARYRIADQAVSPTVSFQFEGRGEADGARLPWTGAGGSRGEVSLHLLNSGALEVTWVAHQLGEELALISGTAKLVRRLD